MAEVDNLPAEINNKLVLNDSNEGSPGNESLEEARELEKKWNFSIEEIYKLALTFYKEKEGKAMHLTYSDKLKLVAYSKQVACGPFDPSSQPPLGVLDVIGNDRRKEWLGLGEMGKPEAMTKFCRLLASKCPTFDPYLEAHQREKEERERIRREEEEKRRIAEEEERERQRQEENVRLQAEQEKLKQEQQRLQIQTYLNQQTYPQFLQYAQQQFPDDPQRQQVVIKQLQDNYYQQYMQQLYQQQQQAATGPPAPGHTQPTPPGAAGDMATVGTTQALPSPASLGVAPPHEVLPVNGDGEPPSATKDDQQNDQEGPPTIASASMWCQTQIQQFKEQLAKDPESTIKVGRGETVTIRVPTHGDGSCLFWEFATDYYDLGFGLYFEWGDSLTDAISVHVDSSDEDEEFDEDEVGENGSGRGDLERGKKDDDRPPTDEIIPVYRRDSHEKVFAGSHVYPGKGVYLLKFDNSYSLFRSKTLYYRVYYSK